MLRKAKELLSFDDLSMEIEQIYLGTQQVVPSVQAKSIEILQSLFPKDKIIHADLKCNQGSREMHTGEYFIIPAEYAHEVSDAQIEMGVKKNGSTEKVVDELRDNFFKMNILGHLVPEMLAVLSKETKVNLADIPMNDSTILVLLQSDDSEVSKSIIANCRLSDFSDLLKVFGLSHGTGVWYGNAQSLLQDDKVEFKYVLAFREDVYHCLIGHGADCEATYCIMESARKGRISKDFGHQTFKKYGLPVWFYPCISNIKYLFPKAHAVSYVQMAVQLAWFKEHYNDLFAKELNKTI